MNPYIGHSSQLSGVEEHRLVGGKGDGMRLYQVVNGKGMELTVSLDRNADISRLRFKGINMGYFSPCGYAAPAFYDKRGTHWLETFTAGFMTTCGLQSAGVPCVEEGEELPLHGSIGNTPSEHNYYEENDEAIFVHGTTHDETIFGRKLVLERVIEVRKDENAFIIHDRITNTGVETAPMQILYHMNMGYPLLDEDSVIDIPSSSVTARNEHAQEDIANWMHMQKPEAGYEERCYYHKFADGRGKAAIFQPKLNVGLEITADATALDAFVEWKMMGVRDYALGLEFGNSYPDGRDVARRSGMLKFIEPGKSISYDVKVSMIEK